MIRLADRSDKNQIKNYYGTCKKNSKSVTIKTTTQLLSEIKGKKKVQNISRS